MLYIYIKSFQKNPDFPI